ncbi:nephrocystin-1-like [Lingula anatina]|uniref:Nephrocystin-1-like n=1 Tax=Lingula anatina TaxID=7574 RepID=A0A1S3KEG0_LINAN|nr:nephrocystin-1-like [Lingula anatina]|eukprot:XP_013420887.2 nephrocystin-1-like [Lingula anatina]
MLFILEEENEDDEKEDTKTPRSGKKLWSSIKKSLKETSATDVLHAMGAVPSGFRLPTLGKLYADGDEYTMKNYLIPKLSTSNLSFRDLFFNPVTNKIRPRPVRFQKIVTLQAARQIPHAGTGIEVINYCVRMCLFDGAKVLSNIVTVRSFCTDKELKNWSFHTKLTDNLPCVDYAEIFVRDNKGDKDIGVLFELCLGYKRVKTGELGEFSCGWAHLPLFAEDGTPALNKTYDLYVNGGTPYEKGIEVDPSVSRRESTNKWRALVSKNRQPRLSVKLSAPTKEQKEQLDTLPDVLVGSMCHLGSLSYYRQFLADALLRDRLDMQSTDLVHSPFLMSFPSVMEQPDILDVFRASWIEKLKITKRGDKRDAEHMKELFRQTFLETCYPLCHSANLQHYKFGDADVEQNRAAELTKIAQMNKEKNSALAALLSPDVAHLPFDMKELSFDVLGPFCLVK